MGTPLIQPIMLMEDRFLQKFNKLQSQIFLQRKIKVFIILHLLGMANNGKKGSFLCSVELTLIKVERNHRGKSVIK